MKAARVMSATRTIFATYRARKPPATAGDLAEMMSASWSWDGSLSSGDDGPPVHLALVVLLVP